MSKENILNALKRMQNGNFSTRIGEDRVDPGLRPIAEMINEALGQFEKKLDEVASVKKGGRERRPDRPHHLARCPAASAGAGDKRPILRFA